MINPPSKLVLVCILSLLKALKFPGGVIVAVCVSVGGNVRVGVSTGNRSVNFGKGIKVGVVVGVSVIASETVVTVGVPAGVVAF